MTFSPHILGIDPGLDGAYAIISKDRLCHVENLPTMGSKKGRIINGGDFADTLRPLIITRAIIEDVHAFPNSGASRAFKFGATLGTIQGVIQSLGIPIIYVAPSVWKKHFRLPADKECARRLAIETWPDYREKFRNKKDHDLAEAALIAKWGARDI